MRFSSLCSIALTAICVTACTTCEKWTLTSIEGHCPPANYHRCVALPEHSFNGLKTEFVWNGAERHCYLNTSTLFFPLDPKNNKHIQVDIEVEGICHSFFCFVFEGRQRVELTQEAQELLILALLQNIPVSISIGSYQETLSSENFPALYTHTISKE